MQREVIGKVFRIKCGSKYFDSKYKIHDIDPVIEVQEKVDYCRKSESTSFLYIGRILAEGRFDLLEGDKTYYGKIIGLGEFVHESELGEEVQ